MLANNLTLDEEDAVQEELKALQEQAVRIKLCSCREDTDTFARCWRRLTRQLLACPPFLLLYPYIWSMMVCTAFRNQFGRVLKLWHFYRRTCGT